MQNEWLMGFSTSILERANILCNKYLPDKHSLETWKERKSLLTNDDFKDMLSYRQIKEDDYNIGVSALDESDLKNLFQFVKKQEWYKLHKSIFSITTNYSLTLDTALRFHCSYFSNQIRCMLKKHPFIQVDEPVINELQAGLLNNLKAIADATLAWDVHKIKDRLNISKESPEEEFATYIRLRFHDSVKTQLFFLEYPTLSKLLSLRVKCAIDNFSLFIEALKEAHPILNKEFGISTPLILQSYSVGMGDSHRGGKSPILLKLNGLKLIFKYRNDQIGNAFRNLLKWIEGLDPNIQFYTARSVSSETYTFEEYIPHENCKSISEVQEYYLNYGYLLGVIYWLNSSDLHMENLIAKGKFPVLIDLETILTQEDRRIYDTANLKNRIIEHSSIIKSGLLPMGKFWQRQLEINALTGTKQKLPFRVRKLINQNTSEIAYELADTYYMGSNNIPLLNNKEADYKKYISRIEKGYLEINQLLLDNREEFIEKIEQYFSNCDFRVLLRDTQDYANIISFANHPSCMVDYIEREKIFENFWSCSFINKSIVSSEVEELLNNDIPFFFTNSSKRTLYSDKMTVEKFFRYSAIVLTHKHVDKITQLTIHHSSALMHESLGNLIISRNSFEIPNRNRDIADPLLAKAADIGDFILDKLLINDDDKLVIWMQMQPDTNTTYKLGFPNNDLYGGSAGLFIFLYYLNYFVPKKSYQRTINVLELEIFHNENSTEVCQGAYHGIGAKLTSAFFAYRLTGEIKHQKLVLFYIKKLIQLEDIEENEWLYGKSSLVSLLCSIVQVMKLENPNLISFIKRLTLTLDSIPIQNKGFAHGDAGVLYALCKANLILQDKMITNKINLLRRELEKHLTTADNINYSWCRGLLGLNKSLDISARSSNYSSYNIKEFMDNCCLCHGSYGQLDQIIDLYLNGYIDKRHYIQKMKILSQRPLAIDAPADIPTLGLYCGFAGIGYQILRYLFPKEISSILFL